MEDKLTSGKFLLLGSNLSNPLLNIEEAKILIDLRAGKILRASSLYKTAAWGLTDQPHFYNQVIEIETELDPETLLQNLGEIETMMGRDRKVKWGPRVIDIDILFYDDRVIDSESLKVPHPGIQDRRFTLIPLAELVADSIHPVLRKTIAELLSDCQDTLPVEKIGASIKH